MVLFLLLCPDPGKLSRQGGKELCFDLNKYFCSGFIQRRSLFQMIYKKLEAAVRNAKYVNDVPLYRQGQFLFVTACIFPDRTWRTGRSSVRTRNASLPREDLKIAGCWFHARHRFDEAVKALPKAKQKDSSAYLALTMIQAIRTLKIALDSQCLLMSGLILYSDQGSQYTSKAFVEFCESAHVTQSMSKAGYPYGNAPMERYFNTLKNECTLYCLIPDSLQATI